MPNPLIRCFALTVLCAFGHGVAGASDFIGPVSIEQGEIAVVEAPSHLVDADLISVRHAMGTESLWQLNVGSAILTRGTMDGSTIMERIFPFPTETILSGSDFRFGYAAGPDISGVRLLRNSQFFDAIDFRYFDVQSMSAATQVDTNNINWRFAADSTSSIPGSGNVDAQYVSQLYSFEFNLRRTIGDSEAAWLSGFRWLQVDDSMGLIGTRTNGQTNSWNWNTNNNLYGYQVGAFVPLIASSSPWSLSVSPKAGIYGNQCMSRWDDGIPAGTIDNTNSIFRNQVAFVGDLSVRLGYRVAKWCTLQAGYQLLWLNGIGVAADQAEVLGRPATATGLNSSGSAFFHGALAGVTIDW